MKKKDSPNADNAAPFRLPWPVSHVLSALTGDTGIVLFKLLTAVLLVLLDKYTYPGGEMFTVAVPSRERRPRRDAAKQIRLLELYVPEETTFKDLLNRVGETLEAAPAVLPAEAARCDAVLSLESFFDRRPLEQIETGRRFDFSIDDDRVTGYLEYEPSEMDKAAAARMADHFINLLRAILSDWSIQPADIDILCDEEKKELLETFNVTDAAFPDGQCYHHLFEDRVERAGHRIAAVSQSDHLSYDALNTAAHRTALRLREKGVSPGAVVGIMTERSARMVIGVLGILKTGAAYLPLDPALPTGRIRYMLDDSGADVVVSDGKSAGSTERGAWSNEGTDVGNERMEYVYLDEINKDGLDFLHAPRSTPHAGRGRASDPAYVIYTSGTTGRPKGVLLEHRSLVNLCYWHNRYYRVTEHDHAAQYAAFSFDASVWELFPYLLTGAAVHIIGSALKLDIEKLAFYFDGRDITIAFLPTQFCEHFLKQENRSLRVLLTGGDKLHRFEKTGYVLYNNYGPTENTVVTTSYPVSAFRENIPIGKPVDNCMVYILDRTLRHLQPVGAPGELCIAGAGLARGYLNHPELTHEKFQVFSLNTHHSTPITIYKTGDLARWLPDGDIEFLGRIDHQVKIRGFRIETGEIESLLRMQPGVEEVLVTAREDGGGERYLCAYYSARGPVEDSALKEALAQQLPDYMVPAYFAQLDRFPLTPNGKVDRNALPAPTIEKKREQYAPPGSDTEKKLAAIWADLLNMEKTPPGVDDDFFSLGGHSLKAVVMTTEIHKHLNVKIPITEVFKTRTIRNLARLIAGAEKERYISIKPVEKREYYPQSSAQKRLFILHRMDTESTVYNVQLLDINYEGIERDKLQEAFRRLIRRHEILRTSFFMLDGEAVQRVHHEADFQIEWYESWEGRGRDYDWKRREGKDERRKLPGDHKRFDVELELPGVPVYEIVENFVRPFDLARPPLLRVGLINVRNARQIFMLDIHHIITDGISMNVFVEELTALYRGKALPRPEIHYKDFSQWAHREKDKGELKRQRDFWLKAFAGGAPVLELPTDHPRPATLSFAGDIHYLKVEAEAAAALNALARSEHSTLYMVLLSAFYVLSARLSGREDIVVGTVTAGRRHADIQRVMGMFVNTLALRNRPSGEKTMRAFMAEVRRRTLEAFDNQDFQFDELAGCAASRTDAGRNPLFDVSFGLENELERRGYLAKTAAVGKPKPFKFKTDRSKFDLTVIAAELDDELLFGFEYNTRLFETDTIERFTGYYKMILEELLRDPDQRIGQVNIIPEEEKQQLLVTFNGRDTGYAGDRTIHGLFEDQVRKTPGFTAVIGAARGDTHPHHLTYGELNRRAARLAGVLREKGISGDTVVGVTAERTVEMATALLGILKAGGAYLPIDPAYPKERITYMLADSGAGILVSGVDEGTLLSKLSEESEVSRWSAVKDIVYLDELQDNRANALHAPRAMLHAGRAPDMGAGASGLAYVIYTSGTTGKPKGVTVEHRSIVNYIRWRLTAYAYSPADITLQLLSYAFDGFCSNFYSSLLSGGALILIPDSKKMDFVLIKDIVVNLGVTNMSLVPGMYNALLGITGEESFKSLRFVVLAGEKANEQLIKRSGELNPHLRHIIEYGPTEATVTASAKIDINFTETAVIGKPISNVKTFVLDNRLKPLPIGVPGELCIAGAGTARGYLNRPELTYEKFQAFSLNTRHSPPTTIYKTGDLARWLPDGNIEFLGRIDRQVKIRGFRIELSEIENRLREIEGIDDAVVIDRQEKSGGKYLCAYLVSDDPVDAAALRETLAAQLPDYMIPAHFLTLYIVPLTPNGKVDIAALPIPAPVCPDQEYEAPENENQRLLVEIWQQVLDIDKIGIDDDFFSVGGDSIKAIQIVSKLKKSKLTVPAPQIFSAKTIRRLSPLLKHAGKTRAVRQGVVTGDVPPTPIQEWFFANHAENANRFNQAVLLYRKEELDTDAVEKTLARLTAHHDALRMMYPRDEQTGLIKQTNRGISGKLFQLDILRLRETDREKLTAELETAADRVQRSIDPAAGPLVKAVIFKGPAGDYLLMVIHHFVTDGVSWRILLEDLETGYRQAKQKKDIVFQEKTDSFQRWARKLRKYAGSRELLKQIPFWRAVEQTPPVPLPVDTPIEGAQRTFRHSRSVRVNLGRRETKILLTKVNRAYNTQINDILLTALGLTLRRWAGVERPLISLESHGREPIANDLDVSRTVGWFTTQYPLVLDMTAPEKLSYTIKQVKETLRRVPHKGIGYGILEYLTPADRRKDVQFKHAPEIAFNYMGSFSGEPGGDSGDPGFQLLSGVSGPGTGNGIDPGFRLEQKIMVEGMISGGILEMDFLYDHREYRRDTIAALGERYKNNLSSVIRHCRFKRKYERTPSDFGRGDLAVRDLDRLQAAVKKKTGKKQVIEAIYPLTPLQRDVFFYSQRHSGLCFVHNMVSINGQLDEGLLEESTAILSRRFDALRSLFVCTPNGEPLRVVLENKPAKIDFIDISRLTPRELKQFLETFGRREGETGFDITGGRLMKLVLFKVGESRWKLAWNFHHILMNGYCFGIVFEAFLRIYRRLRRRRGRPAAAGNGEIRSEPAPSFREYTDWLGSRDRDAALQYWRKYLDGAGAGSALADFGAAPGDDYRFRSAQHGFVLEEEVSDALVKTAAGAGVTISTLFKVLWARVLGETLQRDDVVFGVVVSGRPPEIEGVQRMVGLLVNVTPVRIRLGFTGGLTRLLRDVQQRETESKAYQYLPLSEIEAARAPGCGAIDHILAVENAPLENRLKTLCHPGETGFEIEEAVNEEKTNFDFTTGIIVGKRIGIEFHYNSLVYRPEFVKKIVARFKKVLKACRKR